MTPLETEANPNIRVGPLRWGRPGSPKTTMEMGVHRVHGSSGTPRVSPAPLTSTQRRHGHIDRVGRGGRSRERTLREPASATRPRRSGWSRWG